MSLKISVLDILDRLRQSTTPCFSDACDCGRRFPLLPPIAGLW